MSNILKIKGRVTGGAGAGAPPSLGVRELAYNEEGHMVADAEADASENALFIGGKTDATKVLVSNRRQVEVTGKQNKILGRKSFQTLAFGGIAGDGSDDVLLPPKGTATSGQILKLNGTGKRLEWGNVAGITTVHMDISDSGATSLEAAIDAMDFTAQGGSPTHTPSNTELLVLSYKGSAYLWTGPAGVAIGSGGAHPAVVADTTSLGSAVAFANDAAVKAGVAAASAVAPDTLKDNYLRRTQQAAADVPQTMANTLAMSAELTMGADVKMAGNSILGTDNATRFSMNFGEIKVADALKVGAVIGGIKGDSTTVNQLDGFILDAGTF